MIDTPTRDRPTPAVRRISTAWAPFRRALEHALAELGEGRFLILSVKRSGRCIQFAGQGSHGLRAEVIGNAYLPEADRFGPTQLARLDALGWRPPTGTPEMSTPEQDPDGSPNHHLDLPAPVDAAALAETAVRTFMEALEVPHPGWLEYRAFDADTGPFEVAGLGLRSADRSSASIASRDATPPTPEALLLAALREATGVDTLDVDEDRDIGLRYASLPVLVRLVDRPPRVRIHAVVLDDAEPGVELLARLDALNAQAGGIRWFSSGRRVVAVTEIPAAPIVAAHVAQALHGFCETVEGLARAMQMEFGEGEISLLRGGEGRVLH